MNKTKLDIVKEVLPKHTSSVQEGKDIIDESARVQSTYNRKLQNGIKLVSSFIDQASISIEELHLKGRQNSQENIISLKREIIALSDTYGRLPYLSDKGDVIGIASASTVTNELVQQLREASANLSEKINKDSNERKSIEALALDYERILQLVDQKIIIEKDKLTEVREKTNHMGLEKITNHLKVNSLDAKLKESYDLEDLLLNYLKRIVIKFLALGDWEFQQVTAEEIFQENVNLCMQLVDNLVMSSIRSVESGTKGDWVIINPNSIERKLINHLIMNNLVISSEASTKDRYVLMLRSFGSGF